VDSERERGEARCVDVDTAVKEIRAIERRFAPAQGASREALRAQLREWRQREPDVELRVTVGDSVGEAVFRELCTRYGVEPFRRPRQQGSTITILAPRGFVQTVLHPQFEQTIGVVLRAMHATVNRVFAGWCAEQHSRG
jgi:hypothetical protein